MQKCRKNIINLKYFLSQFRPDHTYQFYKISEDILEHYNKDNHHIQSWEPRCFITLHASLGFEYVEHSFIEGVILPFGPLKHATTPWGGRYYHTNIKGLKNLSYTMLFKFRKVKFIDINPED